MNHAIDMAAAPRRVFAARELTRVGLAATMMVFGGTVIIVLMTMMLGHYNSLAHCGPKAVLDGAVIALLVGTRGRWRCVALLGVVYGLVLLMQVGIAYLPVVMSAAGVGAAVAGWTAGLWRRGVAVVVAAVVFEWLAGFGTPIKIWFGTADGREPILWGIWFAEWPLRMLGAGMGAAGALRWMKRRSAEVVDDVRVDPHLAVLASRPIRRPCPLPGKGEGARRRVAKARGARAAGFALVALLLAAIVPLSLQSWGALIACNVVVLAYALWSGLRGAVLKVVLGIAWGWLVFAGASYLWHQDAARVVDLGRTFALRFLPMSLASVALVARVRPVDLLKVLRRCGLPGAVLLPLSSVARQLPRTQREIAGGFATLRSRGQWTGPWSVVRRPRVVLGTLLWRPLRRWAHELAE